MDEMEYISIIFLWEIIGTIAFASSGALVGIRRNMDIFGVMVLGITTAVGGGCLRDLILGIHPPKMFHNFAYVGTAIATSCLLFLVIYWKKDLLESHFLKRYELVMSTFDAVGLGIFTIIGVRTAVTVSDNINPFLTIFVGVITGIGGGIIRDILASTTPFILVKHVYACASLIGATLYIFLYHRLGEAAVMIISAATIIIIRLMAMYYRWNLPTIRK